MRQQPDRLALHASTQGCFHAKDLRVVVQQSKGEYFLLAADVQGERRKVTPGYATPCCIAPIAADEAHAWIERIMAVLSRPQHLAENTSTTVYECAVSWRHGGTTTQ